MLQVHPNARRTEPSGTVARRCAISAETVRKWRARRR